MLNLEELVFRVNTKELTEAVTEIQNLGKAVTELGNKTTTVNVKVKKTDDAVKAQTKAVKESTEETKKNVSILERQQDVLNFMAQGFSKGQASVLSYAKAAGAATTEITELGKVLDRQRTLMGTDPFDKSIGAMKALKNEYTVLREVNRLYNSDIELSKKQMNELAREKLRLIEKLKIEGKTLSDVKQALRDLSSAYIQNANAENSVDNSMRRRQKTIQDTAKANEYLAKEMERVNRMMGNTDNITSTTNNKLIKFEQALKQSGMTAAQQAAALEKYKKALLEIQQAGGNRQVDYLSRALGPQITDVFVGLATGQSPLMVLLQQGGQLRDQFALAGVAGADMGKMLTQAAASMVVSIKDVSMAVGGLFINSIMGAGKAVTGFVTSITGTDAALTAMKARLIAMEGIASGSGGTTGLVRVFNLLATAVTTFTGVVAGMALAGIVAYGVGLYKVIKEEDALAKQLALTGNAMGLSFDSALRLSKEMNTLGVNTGDAMKVLGEMAKTGGFVSSELAMVSKAAVDMQTYFGVSIEDTVKSFAKMKKEPVEALFELAKTTGLVTTETIKSVVELREQGKTAEATALAMKTLAQVNSQQVEQMKKDYNGFSLFLIDLGKGIKDFFNEAFKAVFYKADPMKQLENRINQIKKNLEGADPDNPFIKGQQDLLRQLNSQLGAMVRMNAEKERLAELQAKEQANYQEALKLADQYGGKVAKQAAMTRELAEAERKFLPLVQSGVLSKEKYNNIIAGIRDKYKETNKEVNEYDKYMARSLESVRDLAIETANARKEEEEITKAAKMRADLMDDPLWNKHTEQAKINLLAALDILEAQEKINKAVEKEKKLREELLKEDFKRLSALEDVYDVITKSQEDQSKSLSESAKDLDFQYSVLGKSDEEVRSMTREYERQNKLRKAFLEYEKGIDDIRKLEKSGVYSSDEVNRLRLNAEKNYAEQIRQINSETALKAAEDYQKAFREIQGTITDIIATALFEGGKAGQQKLKDLLKNAFRNFVINVLINPVISGGINAVLGIGGGSGGIGSSIAGAANNYLTNTALGSLLTSTGGYAAAIGGGSVAAGSQAAMLAAQTAEFGVAGTALTAQAAGSATGGIASSVMNGLSAIPGWGWALAGAALLLGSGFGQTPGEQHMGGMYSTRGSELNMETARSITGGGGWDDGAWARDLTERGSEQVGGALKIIVDGALGEVNDAIAVFGMGPFTIDAGMAANLNGEGSDPNVFGYFNLYDEAGNLVEEYINRELGSDLTAAIAKFGGDIQEAVASVVLEGTNFKREGETNVQTLQRLSTSLTAVNQVTDLLGMKSLELSLAGGDAASSLVDLFGSVENLQSASQSFYDQFASDSTKLADAQSLLDTTFSSLGMTIPQTREEYYRLVQGLDLTTEAGRAAYAALLNAGDAFLYVEDSAARAAEEAQREADRLREIRQRAAEEAQREAERAYQEQQRMIEEAERARVDRLKDAFSKLESAINKEIEARKQGIGTAYSRLEKVVNAQLTSVQKQYDLIKAVHSTLIASIRSLRGGVASTSKMQVSEATAFIANALQQARRDGSLPNGVSLEEAIDIVNSSIENTSFKSLVEANRARLELSNDLQELANIAEPQLSNTELQLRELEKILVVADAIVSAVNGGSNLTQAQTDAILNSAADWLASAGTLSGNQISAVFDANGLLANQLTSSTAEQIAAIMGVDGSVANLILAQQEFADAILSEQSAEQSIEQLQEILANAKDQLNALLGINDSVLGVKAAIDNWVATLANDSAPITSVGGGGNGVVIGGTVGTPTNAYAYNPTGRNLRDYIYSLTWGGIADDISAWTLYNTSKVEGWTQQMIADAAGYDLESVQRIFDNAGVPRFADGGAFTNGIVTQPTAFNMGVMGEAGSEAIMPLTNIGGSLGVKATSDPSLAEAIDRMNSNIELLRAEIRADVSHNSKTARLLDRVIQDGRTISVTADLDGGTI